MVVVIVALTILVWPEVLCTRHHQTAAQLGERRTDALVPERSDHNYSNTDL